MTRLDPDCALAAGVPGESVFDVCAADLAGRVECE